MTTTTELAPMRLDQVPAEDILDGTGIRTAVEVDEGFVQSIRENGILQPLIVAPAVYLSPVAEAAGGRMSYRLIAGRRRLAAARVCGHRLVPVIVREDLADSAELVAEIVENVQRQDLTVIEKARAYEQLAAFDLSDLEIAERVGEDIEAVGRHLRVVRSKPAARVAAKSATLTIEQACALAEFEDDSAVLKDLEAALRDRPERFEHQVSYYRRERENAEKRAALIAKLESAGVSILKPAGGYNGFAPDSQKAVRLENLADDKGKRLTVAKHRKCQGHSVFVPDLRHYHGQDPVYYCGDPAKFGHKKTSYHSVGGSEKSESQKAEESAKRKLTIANNKLWRAATVVRVEFVRKLCTSPAPPKGHAEGMLRLVASRLARKADVMSYKESALGELVGVGAMDDGPGYSKYGHQLAGQLIDKATSTDRLIVVLFSTLAAELELEMTRTTWQGDYWGQHAAYLSFLGTCGYGLAEVEEQLIAREGEPF